LREKLAEVKKKRPDEIHLEFLTLFKKSPLPSAFKPSETTELQSLCLFSV
jgi:hypothetical protein